MLTFSAVSTLDLGSDSGLWEVVYHLQFWGKLDPITLAGCPLGPDTQQSHLIPLMRMCKPQPGSTLRVILFALYSVENKDLKWNVLRSEMLASVARRGHHSLLLGPAASLFTSQPGHEATWVWDSLQGLTYDKDWKRFTGIFPAEQVISWRGRDELPSPMFWSLAGQQRVSYLAVNPVSPQPPPTSS